MASFLFFCFSFFFIYKKEWLFGKIQGSVSLTATVRPTGDAVQAVNLAGFRASEDPRFEAGIGNPRFYERNPKFINTF